MVSSYKHSEGCASLKQSIEGMVSAAAEGSSGHLMMVTYRDDAQAVTPAALDAICGAVQTNVPPPVHDCHELCHNSGCSSQPSCGLLGHHIQQTQVLPSFLCFGHRCSGYLHLL
jgi:hypothetical protein